ncbi:MAG: metallophosphoesterase [Desulfomonilaceae bacterium]|nr:metallophosphoesterase [Desulfomonilaceae bacterium]
MNNLTLILAVIGACAILCQWFVFTSIRTYLFEKYGPMSRRIAYPVLIVLGTLNFAAGILAFNTEWFPPDTHQRKVVTVLFFSYLGFVLTMSLFFLALAAFSRTLNIKDKAVALIRKNFQGWKRPIPAASDRAGTGKPVEPVISMSTDAPALVTEMSRPEKSRAVSYARNQREADRASRPPSPSRRAFLKWSTAAGIVGVAGYAGHGVAQAYRDPVVDKSRVIVPESAGLSRPLTLIHITDFHFGLFVESPELMRLIDQVNAIEGDAVVITGDVFHSRISPVESAAPLLKKLRPRPLGNFAVLGNHDFYAGERRSVDTLREGGLTLLRDQWETVEHGKSAVHFGGIDDPLGNWIWGKEFPGFQSFVEKAPGERGVRILLSHRPNVLSLAAKSNMDLVLAGHTHGGQVILPTGNGNRGLSLARLASPYTHGWYREGATRMYLNRGVGLTFVPWRINCPPEIAVVRLVGRTAA